MKSLYDVTLIAGSQRIGSGNGIGANSRFANPTGITISSDGTFALIADSTNCLIRKVVISTLEVTTFVGQLSSGSNNGIGTNAKLNNPNDVQLSPDDSYALVGDQNNQLVRKIVISTSQVTTFAGLASSTGSNNGVGTNAKFNFFKGVSIVYDGSYALVADSNNHVVRKIEISTVDVTTFAGTVSTSGTSDGFGTNSRFNWLYDVQVAPNGVFALVADTNSHTIRKIIMTTAEVTTLAGTPASSGFANGVGTSAKFNTPRGVSISSDNSYVLVTDTINHQIRQIIISTRTVTTLVGSNYGYKNGYGTNAYAYYPQEIMLSPDSSYALFSDFDSNQIRKVVVSTAIMTLFVGQDLLATDVVGTGVVFNEPAELRITSNGLYAYIVDYGASMIRKLEISTSQVTSIAGNTETGSTNGVGTNALFNQPYGLSLSLDDSYALIADRSNHVIRKLLLSTSEVTTFAGTMSSYGSTNGVGTNAQFSAPYGITISPDGSYAFVVDTNNRAIRTLILSTIAVTLFVGGSSGNSDGFGTNAQFDQPYCLGFANDGSFVIVTDSSSFVIRKIVVSTGEVTTIAGSVPSTDDMHYYFPTDINGIGTSASFDTPRGVALFSDDSYALIASRWDNSIRKLVISTLEVSTLAGSTSSGTNNGVGTNAKFSLVNAVTFSHDFSYTLISEGNNNMIRKLTILDTPTTPPTSSPTGFPTSAPSSPSSTPTFFPSRNPTLFPSMVPSLQPSQLPSSTPSFMPTNIPTMMPTTFPTSAPTIHPTLQPTLSYRLTFSNVPITQRRIQTMHSDSPHCVLFTCAPFRVSFFPIVLHVTKRNHLLDYTTTT